MRRIFIAKAKIVEALQTEELSRLRAGAWIGMPDEGQPIRKFGKFKEGTCMVCAVGAVLRRVLPQSTTADALHGVASRITDRAIPRQSDHRKEAKHLALDGNVWSGLSVLFEGEMAGRQTCTESIRRRLIGFVKNYFPERLALDPTDYWL